MLKRSVSSGLLFSAAVMAAVLSTAPRARADDAPAASGDLKSQAADFLHYSRVNNVELAKANAEAILAGKSSPTDIWKAFEDVSEGTNYRDVMLQDQRRPDLKEDADKLLSKVDEGYRAQARDPQLIRREIDNLANGPRAYQNARDRLAAAGEYAVPLFLEYLQNPSKQELRPFILRAMGEIGRPLLTPLVEELRVTDPTLKMDLAKVLGQIGYPQALPALRAMDSDSALSPAVKMAVEAAITQIDSTGAALKLPPADLYLRGAQNYYNKRISYQPLNPDEPKNPVWYFDAGLNNVTPVPVPTVIWNDVMALRMAEATLRTDPSNAAAISLWNAANIRRELRLPQGETDPTRTPDSQDAAFYALAAGPQYINPVLAMALDENDNPLALKAIDVLERTGGISGLVSSADAPLVRALGNPDRAVRFHAAFALARANPVSQYPSFFRVIPLLAEAVNSNATPSALLVVNNDDLRNAAIDMLRNSDLHLRVYAGKTASSAIEAAQGAPAFDVVIVPEGPEHDQLMKLERTDYRLMGVPFLITAPADELPKLSIELQGAKGHAALDEKLTADNVKEALTKARGDASAAPLGDKDAEAFATQALDLLAMLAADHRSIYSVAEITPTLVDALQDKRPAVVTGSARVLGEMNSPEGEQALAKMALNENLGNPDRVMFFNQLRESAKRTGNTLDAEVINGVIRTVSSDTDGKVREAAAGALGALNVPSNQSSTLILKQAK